MSFAPIEYVYGMTLQTALDLTFFWSHDTSTYNILVYPHIFWVVFPDKYQLHVQHFQ
jgi:hypothetical protein